MLSQAGLSPGTPDEECGAKAPPNGVRSESSAEWSAEFCTAVFDGESSAGVRGESLANASAKLSLGTP